MHGIDIIKTASSLYITQQQDYFIPFATLITNQFSALRDMQSSAESFTLILILHLHSFKSMNVYLMCHKRKHKSQAYDTNSTTQQ